MTDFPKRVLINEEGPREGFQIESGSIATADKVALTDALAKTGVRHIQVVSFVHPKLVPGMADAEAVMQKISPVEGVSYTGLWLNLRGFQRACEADNIHLEGVINLYASPAFLKKNQNRTEEQQLKAQHEMLDAYKEQGVPVKRSFISAAFGCNYQGDIDPAHVVKLVDQILDLANQHGEIPGRLGLGDTMAWATPERIKRVVGAVRNKHPDLPLSLHLHDTRGMGIANAYAGLSMGVDAFDSCVAGLGGCPFAGHRGAAGNVCTEDLVFMCEEMGIETGIDLEKMIECARMAERIVGHELPGSLMRGGALSTYRNKLPDSKTELS